MNVMNLGPRTSEVVVNGREGWKKVSRHRRVRQYVNEGF